MQCDCRHPKSGGAGARARVQWEAGSGIGGRVLCHGRPPARTPATKPIKGAGSPALEPHRCPALLARSTLADDLQRRDPGPPAHLPQVIVIDVNDRHASSVSKRWPGTPRERQGKPCDPQWRGSGGGTRSRAPAPRGKTRPPKVQPTVTRAITGRRYRNGCEMSRAAPDALASRGAWGCRPSELPRIWPTAAPTPAAQHRSVRSDGSRTGPGHRPRTGGPASPPGHLGGPDTQYCVSRPGQDLP